MTEFERQCRERARILGRLRGLAEASDPATAEAEGVALPVEYLRLIGAGDLAEAFCSINPRIEIEDSSSDHAALSYSDAGHTAIPQPEPVLKQEKNH